MKKHDPILWCALFLGVCLCTTLSVRANVVLAIDDSQEVAPNAVGVFPYGFDPATVIINRSIDPAGFELFDLHGEYVSALVLQSGTVKTFNANFIEADQSLSDTLGVTFTWQTPTVGDPNNLSVDLHFRSDSDSPGNVLTPLAGAVNLQEVPGYMVMDPLIVAAGGPADFSLSVQSDAVPLPNTAWAGMGLCGLLLGARLIKRTAQSQRV